MAGRNAQTFPCSRLRTTASPAFPTGSKGSAWDASQRADIGLRGDVAHVGERFEEAVDIGLGGSLGPDAAFIDWVAGAVPVDTAPTALSNLLVRFARTGGRRTVLRLGPPGRQRDLRSIMVGADVEPGGVPAMKRYRLREEMNGIDEPPGKVWFWELAAGVIDADRCIQCGTCVAVCPSNSIGVNEDSGLPELVKMCTGARSAGTSAPRRAALRGPVAALDRRGRQATVTRARLVRHLLEDHRRPARRRAGLGPRAVRGAGLGPHRRRPGRRRRQRAPDRPAGGRGDRRRPGGQAERRP